MAIQQGMVGHAIPPYMAAQTFLAPSYQGLLLVLIVFYYSRFLYVVVYALLLAILRKILHQQLLTVIGFVEEDGQFFVLHSLKDVL